MVKKLQNALEIIAWLDSARWSRENQDASTIWEPISSLSPSQSILAHWLTYITDMQRPWQEVWKKGAKIFAEIVESFPNTKSRNSENVSQTRIRVKKFLDTFKGERPPDKVQPFRCNDIEYAPRYSNQHKFIERTLTVLAQSFDGDLMKFLGKSIQESVDKSDGLQRVARDLYFLTYSDFSINRTIALFNGSLDYPNWRVFGYKRLWAALRDYRKSTKYLNVFGQGLADAMGTREGKYLFNLWKKNEMFSLNQLELPGDVWNIFFLEKTMAPLAEASGVDIKSSWGASRIARKIYDSVKNQDYYPEQMDISWDLSSKACANGICDLCPFGNHDLRNICLAKSFGNTKHNFCPITLATCQYRLFCEPETCPVFQGKGRGLCKGIN